MTTHKRTGPPLAELVVRIYEPDYYACLTGDCPHWKQVECDAAMASFCPYQPGDVLEFTNWTEDKFTRFRQWSLRREDGTVAANVWSNGVWHTWDHDGVGGENSTEDTVDHAKHEAEESSISQDFFVPSLRTVTRVEVRQGERWEWVVFTEGKDGNY